MGDMQDCTAPPRGIDGSAAGHSSPPLNQLNPNSSPIEASMWRQAELATHEVIKHIRPTVVSEQRRKAVVEYVQKLIKGFLSSEVFPFGSVPLKTYLPDGDIDLTAISIPSSEDALASDVRSILEGEEHNSDIGFEVKDVQYIQAEVKLVKCLVQNIVVDISFNQIGGLCTLCFLEQVDRFIGKEHLFKRSIILIKAWCYYESRILGAHHGLISTYALETLVLYIFHLFHSSLDGPLAVLYRFLDYYSKFDWDKYCISLRGPVSLSTLPELAVETLDNDGGDLLLTEEFLKSCADSFSVPVRGSENHFRTFNKKHLNIVDPLRESNNLGRSVSKGNFYRIRSAFTYGARKLERLLLLPTGCIGSEVYMFFMNTMDRHGGGERPDVENLVPRPLGCVFADSNDVGFENDPCKLRSESLAAKSYQDLSEEMKNVRISGLGEVEIRPQLQKSPSYKQKNSTKLEPSGEVVGVSSGRLIGDAKDLATTRTTALDCLTESSKVSASTKEDTVLDSRKVYNAPHLVFHPEHRIRNGIKLDQINLSNLGASSNVPLTRDISSIEEIYNSKQPDSSDTDSSLHRAYWPGAEGNAINSPSASLNEMSDLSGEYDIHLNSLHYALWCHEQVMTPYFLPMRRQPQYSFYHHSKDVWSRGNTFAHMNSNVLSPRPPFSPAARYSMSQPFLSSSYNVDDAPKTRGTGTYFPNTNYHVYRERHSPGRIKNAPSLNHMPRPQNNGQADTSQDTSSADRGSHEPFIHAQSVRGRLTARLDIPQWSSRPTLKTLATANGALFSPELTGLEFGSLGPVSVEAPTKEHTKRLDISSSHTPASGFASPGPTSRRPTIHFNKERAYQLKDEDDFPPLSS